MDYYFLTLPVIIITLSELPVADVTIVISGAPIIGEEFTLECLASFDQTVATVMYEWLINGSNVFRDGITLSNNNTILTVNSVNSSDEGSYMCIATLDIAEVPNNTVSTATYSFSTLGL